MKMMSGKEFRLMLAGKTPGEIYAVICSLKKEIQILKNNAENNREKSFRPQRNTDYSVINHDRVYIAEAKKLLEKIGCEYIPDDEEKQDEEFQKSISHIENLTFEIGSFFEGSRNYIVHMEGDVITTIQDGMGYGDE